MLKLLAVTVALSMSSCPGAIGKALRLWGYTEVRPASTLFAPGTVVWVKTGQPFSAGIICPASAALGDDFVPMESLTMNADMSKISKKGVTLDVDVANMVSTNNELHDVRNLKMTLNNGHIYEISDFAVESRRDKASAACLRAVSRRQQAGYTITMISSALMADVSYGVNWDKGSKLSAAAKVEALANLSTKLGLEASSVSDRKIEAKGLYWGIRDDQYLAYIFMDPIHAPPVAPGARTIPNEVVMDIKLPAAGPARPDVGDPNGSARPLDVDGEGGYGGGYRHAPEAAQEIEYVLTPIDPDDL